MAYYNFDLALSKGYTPQGLMCLQIIKQMRESPELNVLLTEVMSEGFVKRVVNDGVCEFIKGKKKDSQLSKIRLTKKGTKMLDEFETAKIEDEDIVIFDWLKKSYDKEGKLIGNGKRIKTGIAQFRNETGISGNRLAFLLRKFLSDSENMKYNNKLENAFFSSKNLYSRKFNINECRVWDFYIKGRVYFDSKFKELK